MLLKVVIELEKILIRLLTSFAVIFPSGKAFRTFCATIYHITTASIIGGGFFFISGVLTGSEFLVDFELLLSTFCWLELELEDSFFESGVEASSRR